MLESRKKIGKYESPILQKLSIALSSKGYDVLTHVRLNVAWSNIISDVDVIAISEKETIIIEVKSNHDNFFKAFSQLRNLKGFADKLYIATDKPINAIKMDKWVDESIGLISVNEKNVEIIKDAKHVNSIPKVGAMSQLPKKCLVQLSNLLGIPTYLTKDEIEKRMINLYNPTELKMIIKHIALCEYDCNKNCFLIPSIVASCLTPTTYSSDQEGKKL